MYIQSVFSTQPSRILTTRTEPEKTQNFVSVTEFCGEATRVWVTLTKAGDDMR